MSREPLKNGTVLRFPDGQEWEIVHLLGGGGSALLYEVKLLGSELYAAMKEIFPIRGYVRRSGQIVSAGRLPRRERELQRRKALLLEQESRLSQQASRKNYQVLFLQPPVHHSATLILPDGTVFTDVENTYARMDSLAEKGISLADWYSTRPAGSKRLDDTLKLMETVLDAYAALHEDGFLHGDCQLSNLFLLKAWREAEGPGTACIIDFGSARRLEADGRTAPITEELFSTDGYCAPELMFPRGEELRLSAAADVWSLGFLLLTLLTERAFEELDGITEYLMLHPEEKSLIPEEAALLGCTPAQEALLNVILTRALDNDPLGRYSNAGAMRTDLQTLLHCRNCDTSKGVTPYQLWDTAWKHRQANPALFQTEHISRLSDALPSCRLPLKGRYPGGDSIPASWILQELAEAGQNAYLYGAGGSGKNVTAAFWWSRWIRHGEERIPLYVNLAACTADLLEQCGGDSHRLLPTLLAHQYFGQTQLADEVDAVLMSGTRYALLADNLHAVESSALPAVLIALNGLQQRWPNIWVLALGRSADPGAELCIELAGHEDELPSPKLQHPTKAERNWNLLLDPEEYAAACAEAESLYGPLNLQRVELLPLTREEILKQIRAVRPEGIDFAAGTVLLRQEETLQLPLFLMHYLELLASGQQDAPLPASAMELLHSYFALREYRNGERELHDLLRRQLPWIAWQYSQSQRTTCFPQEISGWLRELDGRNADPEGFFHRAADELAILEYDGWLGYRFAHDCYQAYFSALFAADRIQQAISRRSAEPLRMETPLWTEDESRRCLELCCLTVRNGQVLRTCSKTEVLDELSQALHKLHHRELVGASDMISSIYSLVLNLQEEEPQPDPKALRRWGKLLLRSQSGLTRSIAALGAPLYLISLIKNPAITQLRALCAVTEDGAAEYQLACRYKHGDGVRANAEKADFYLRKAVEKGYAPAQNALGELEEAAGRWEQAVSLYEQAADRQYPRAMWHLGRLYLQGQGTERNLFHAFELFQQGAQGGDSFCQYDYAHMLEHGWGKAEHRLQEALYWYEKAAAQGLKAAAQAAETLRASQNK